MVDGTIDKDKEIRRLKNLVSALSAHKEARCFSVDFYRDERESPKAMFTVVVCAPTFIDERNLAQLVAIALNMNTVDDGTQKDEP